MSKRHICRRLIRTPIQPQKAMQPSVRCASPWAVSTSSLFSREWRPGKDGIFANKWKDPGMTYSTKIAASDGSGEFDVYVAEPADAPRAAIVVLVCTVTGSEIAH